jgi:tetratricopeptide (TPR) repeat protein
MIVRNEEQNLADCLAPVAHLFDEIVIVDTGSEDRTREIASQFTPHVFESPWNDSFAAARNESLRHAHGDWIFWLDADDRLNPENVAKLESLLSSLGDQQHVYMMDVISRAKDECDDSWATAHPRLFRRSTELRWTGRVHEQLWPPPVSLGYDVLPSAVQIEHVGYQEAPLLFRKRQRKLRLLRMDYAENPDNPSTLFHLGMAHAGLGKHAEARKYLLRLLELQTCPDERLGQVLCTLAVLYQREGKPAEALETIAQGLTWFPSDETLNYLQAQILYDAQHYEAAQTALARIIDAPGPRPNPGDAPADLKRKLAPRLLGAVLRMQGELGAAEEMFQRVLSAFPQETQTWYNLGLVHLDARNPWALQEVVQKLAGCPRGEVFANLLSALWRLRSGQLEGAGALIDKIIEELPQMPLARMLRAELLSRQGAPYEAQIRALRDVLRVQPQNNEAQAWLKQLEAAEAATRWATPAEAWGGSIIMSPGVALTG